MSINFNNHDISTSGNLTANSGNFTTLTVNNSSFNSSVSGLLPTISNSGDNRVLTSTGSNVGINAESNLTFDGSLLTITGSGNFASGLVISNQTASTLASFDSNKNVVSLSTTSYPSLTELSYVKGVTSAIQTQIDGKSSSTHVHGNITNAGAIGSTANLPLITTTLGAITVGSFGTTANTFCQGNDSRLSDTRTPSDGSVTTVKIVDSNVTYAKIQNVSSTSRILGRSSAGAGVIEELDAATVRTLLSVQPTASPTFTGSVQADVANTLLDSTGNLRVFTTDTQGVDRGGQIALGGKNGYGSPFDPWAFACIKGAKENSTSGNFSGYVVFATANSGGVLGERLRISSTGTATFSGQVLVTAGSVSACSVAPSGDPNTGLTFPAADNVAWVTGGVERMRITSGGTTEVRSNNGSISHLFTYNENGGEIILYDETQTAATLFDQISTDTRLLELVSGSNLKLGLGSANTTGLIQFMRAGYQEAMRIDASGNVGIGTAGGSNESGFLLHVAGNGFFTSGPNATTKISVDSGDQRLVLGSYYQFGVAAYSFISATNNAETGDTDLQLRTGTTARMTIAADGKISAAGVYNNTVGATNRDVFVDSGGLIGYVSSIRASKTDIASLDDVSWLSALTPVSYRYRRRNEDGTYSDESDGVTDYGLIAEDVEAVRPELCFYDQVDGEPELRGVTYSKLITPMLKYIQQLEQRIAALEERLSHAN